MICSHPTHGIRRPSAAGRLGGVIYCVGAMNDDWRVRIDVHDDGLARRLTEQLDADELEHDLAAVLP